MTRTVLNIGSDSESDVAVMLDRIETVHPVQQYDNGYRFTIGLASRETLTFGSEDRDAAKAMRSKVIEALENQ